MGKSRAALSANENLFVGMVGGTIETCVNMPVLTWKFCLQEGRQYPRFPAMYRGLTVQAGSVAPLTALQMVFNGFFERSLTGNRRNLSNAEGAICAMGAGAASAILYGPVDLTCIYQQKLSMNITNTVKHIKNQYGLLKLFRGVLPTAGREAFYTAGYLSLAPVFTSQIMKQKGFEDSYYVSAVFGSIAAGIIANVTSHPIDTVKTVLQADISGEKYKNFGQTLRLIVSENGLLHLYKGGLARTVRGSVAFFIISSIREKCIQNKTATGSSWYTTHNAIAS